MSSSSRSSRGGGQGQWPVVCAAISVVASVFSAWICLLGYLQIKSVGKLLRQTETMKSIEPELSQEITAAFQAFMLPVIQGMALCVAVTLCAAVASIWFLQRNQRGAGQAEKLSDPGTSREAC